MVNEEWREVSGWPYEVSSEGRVRNTRTGRMLHQHLHKSGYLQLQLWNRLKFKTATVHVLVCEAFHGSRPSGSYEAAHENGDSTDNRSVNLTWKTPKENIADRDRHGTTARGSRNGKTKYPPQVVARVRELRQAGISCLAVAAETGLSAGYVYRLSVDSNSRRDATVDGRKVPWREYLNAQAPETEEAT